MLFRGLMRTEGRVRFEMGGDFKRMLSGPISLRMSSEGWWWSIRGLAAEVVDCWVKLDTGIEGPLNVFTCRTPRCLSTKWDPTGVVVATWGDSVGGWEGGWGKRISNACCDVVPPVASEKWAGTWPAVRTPAGCTVNVLWGPPADVTPAKTKNKPSLAYNLGIIL